MGSHNSRQAVSLQQPQRLLGRALVKVKMRQTLHCLDGVWVFLAEALDECVDGLREGLVRPLRLLLQPLALTQCTKHAPARGAVQREELLGYV